MEDRHNRAETPVVGCLARSSTMTSVRPMNDHDAAETWRIARANWHPRMMAVVFAWLALAVIAGVLGNVLPDAVWLTVHFALLGAVSNALFIWSWHFSGAILRIPDQVDRSAEVMRLSVLNIGIVGAAIGIPTEAVAVVVGGALFVATAVLMHIAAIRAGMKRALPSPYAFTAYAYLYASALLVTGLFLAGAIEILQDSEALAERLVLAHVSVNVLGWVGIPIIGTIVTLWPTMLRTRIAPNAARLARKALPIAFAATLTIAIGLALWLRYVAAAGFILYTAAIGLVLQPMIAVLRQKRMTTFATKSAISGMAWIALAVPGFALMAMLVDDVDSFVDHAQSLLIAFAAGGVLQVLMGCMTYLLPAMAGGGPAIVRWRNDQAERFGRARLILANVGVEFTIAGSGSMRGLGCGLMTLSVALTGVAVARSLVTPSADTVAAADAARGISEE